MDVEDRDVRLLTDGYAAFTRGDWDATLADMHDHVEWLPAAGPLLGVEVLRGKEELRRFFEVDLREGWEAFEAHPEKFERLDPDRLLATVHYVGRGSSSGIELDVLFTVLVEVRDGQLYRVYEYTSREDALAAAGDDVVPGEPMSPTPP